MLTKVLNTHVTAPIKSKKFKWHSLHNTHFSICLSAAVCVARLFGYSARYRTYDDNIYTDSPSSDYCRNDSRKYFVTLLYLRASINRFLCSSFVPGCRARMMLNRISTKSPQQQTNNHKLLTRQEGIVSKDAGELFLHNLI